jgi:ubiquinone/menaquinone biosynthesis C-methylase UbiE
MITMNPMAWFHGAVVQDRRVRVLARHLASILPPSGTVLDVGCGDGRLAADVARQRPGLTISGIDVLVRPVTYIHVQPFDGCHVPRSDRSVDVVMLIDVLHHTETPRKLLFEAHRVARWGVVIKDHCREGVLGAATLRLMDWVGNAHHGVALPYNYWSRQQWHQAFKDEKLQIAAWRQDLGLYPRPLGWVFDRSLHFVAVLQPARA